MSDEHIEKTISAIESAENIPADRKAELLDFLSKLKPAIAKVSQTHQEDARSIARLVEASAHETIRAEKKPEQTNRLLHELKRSVENFEASHPELTAFVTKYSAVLAALGIRPPAAHSNPQNANAFIGVIDVPQKSGYRKEGSGLTISRRAADHMTVKYSGIDGYVGNTPLIRLRRLSELTECE